MGKMSLPRPYLLCIVAIAALLLAFQADDAHAQTDQPQVTQEAKTQLDELITWVHTNGGYVAEGVAFGYENSIRGIVAGSKGFKAGEVIFDIPNAIILPTRIPSKQEGQDQCAEIALIHEELNKVEESHWWKYLRMDDSLGVRTVALWSETALNELQGLPPFRPRFTMEWYVWACKNKQNIKLGKSTLEYYHQDLVHNEKHSLWMFQTRSAKAGLVPIMDLANHHGALVNMIIERHGEGIRYNAYKDIPPGGAIHNSYGARVSDKIFRTYGFVEAWPQIWSWCSSGCTRNDNDERGETRHRFVLFPDGVAAIEAENAANVCTNCSNVEAYLTAARQYTQGLDSMVLEVFVAAADVFLDGLLTSAGEDAVMLESLNAEIENMADWKPATVVDSDANNPRVLLTDTVAAVEYRLQFKQAVRSALKFGVDELIERMRKEL